VAQEADLGDLTDAIVKELALKRRLSEVERGWREEGYF
jgi:hypothetical protein